jgi:hypothetical protein
MYRFFPRTLCWTLGTKATRYESERTRPEVKHRIRGEGASWSLIYGFAGIWIPTLGDERLSILPLIFVTQLLGPR